MKTPDRFPLPYPPTLNRYYRVVGGRLIISREGRAYRGRVQTACFLDKFDCVDKPFALYIEVYPPDKRKRDLDNVCKALLDALQHARVFADDSLMDVLNVSREEMIPDGQVLVTVQEIEDDE